MNHKLIVKPLAERDIVESYEWYNQKQEGLGDDFVNELERSLEFIKTNPHQYQVRYKESRMVKLRRFPVCVHYIIKNEVIFILSVMGTSRNPSLWTKRK